MHRVPSGLVVLLAAAGAAAQVSVPPGHADALKDTSILKPPPSAKAAIVEFDDLECPSCSKALPLVEGAAKHFNVPVIHHDFTLWEHHPWALPAATTARYLHDAVSAKASGDFRRDVFAHQDAIASPDDLQNFTKQWFAAHRLRLPANLDPQGTYVAEVKEDRDLAIHMGLRGTPTIFVVTRQGWTQVLDATLLDATVGQIVNENTAKASGR